MAQQKSLSCLDINLLYSCEKTFMKSLVVCEIQAFKICCMVKIENVKKIHARASKVI